MFAMKELPGNRPMHIIKEMEVVEVESNLTLLGATGVEDTL